MIAPRRLLAAKGGACSGSMAASPHEPGRAVLEVYLRHAQAYMLISMPTDTSTIFGVFQLIRFS
jgi:hypothetical protein